MRKEKRIRNVFTYIDKYGSVMGGKHHVFGRARVDNNETMISLCSECHWKVHNAKISKCEMIELLEKITGVELRKKYPEFHKCH